MTYQPKFLEDALRADVSPTQGLPTYDARRLTGGDATAQIVLDDKTYTLRITRAGKLILTK